MVEIVECSVVEPAEPVVAAGDEVAVFASGVEVVPVMG